MGVRMRTIQVPDLHGYDPEFNADGTEKHISCDGARFHVLSYSGVNDPNGRMRVTRRCSAPRCELNRPTVQQPESPK